MNWTFRRFMEQGDAAPAASSGASSPDNPAGKKNDASVGDMELDIDPATRDEIDMGEFITSFKPLYFKSHGIKAAPPIFLQVQEKLPNGSARVKVMYSLCNQRKLRNSSGMPLQQPPEDQEAYLSRQELDDIRLGAFDSAAAGGAGAAPGGMGGMPPPPGGLT